MDRGTLMYEILKLRFPKGYRNNKGLVYANKMATKSDADLKEIYRKLKIKRDREKPVQEIKPFDWNSFIANPYKPGGKSET